MRKMFPFDDVIRITIPEIDPCVELITEKLILFSILSQQWEGAGSSKFYLIKDKTCLSDLINTIVVNVKNDTEGQGINSQ